MRQLFPYKSFPSLKGRTTTTSPLSEPPVNILLCVEGGDTVTIALSEVPTNGNASIKIALWTDDEKRTYEEALRAWSRWEGNFVHGYVRSAHCEGTTRNSDEICDACQEIAGD